MAKYEPADNRRQKDARSGRRQKRKAVDCTLGRRLRYHWRNPLDQIVEARNRNLGQPDPVEECFYLRQPPKKDKDAEYHPGQPCFGNFCRKAARVIPNRIVSRRRFSAIPRSPSGVLFMATQRQPSLSRLPDSQ